MEFKFSIKNVATEEVLKIDNTLTPEGHETNDDLKKKIGRIIDVMGKASAVAQQLESPITSADKLVNSDHIVYMMTEHNTPQHFAVVGILKVGWKKLNLFDISGSQSEAMVYCLLDFYIHESRQRKGYGSRLIKHMLQDVNLEAKHLAIEKPTKKLLQFMWKHYQLSKLVNQENNFVIFEEFFKDTLDRKNDSSSKGHNALGYMHQPMFGRHDAHKHHDTMGEIIQGEGDAALVKSKYNHDADCVDLQVNAIKPHPEKLGAFYTDKDGNSVKRDLKFHNNTLWYTGSQMFPKGMTELSALMYRIQKTM